MGGDGCRRSAAEQECLADRIGRCALSLSQIIITKKRTESIEIIEPAEANRFQEKNISG